MSAPAVSVVIPTYNRSALLSEAVASVRGQTFTDWELIVADDGSTDDTAAALGALNEPRLRVLALPHSGRPAVARNAALRAARAPWVAFLDSDDLWAPDKLAAQLEELARAACPWGYGMFGRINEAGAPLPLLVTPARLPAGWIVEALLRLEAVVALPTVMARRDLLEAAGGFDEVYAQCEDYELWLRLAAIGPAHVTRTPLASVRVHPNHLQADRVAVHTAWVRLYEKHAAVSGDARIARLCNARCGAHLLELARNEAAAARPSEARRHFAAALPANWHRPVTWWVLASVLIAPFPRARRMIRRLLGRSS